MTFVYTPPRASDLAYHLPSRTIPTLWNSWLSCLSAHCDEGASGHHPISEVRCHIVSDNNDADAKCPSETAQFSPSWQLGARHTTCSFVSMIPCIAASGYTPNSDWISGSALHRSLFLLPAPYTRYEHRVAICSSIGRISVRSDLSGQCGHKQITETWLL